MDILIYEYEYPEVIENTINLERLKRAWGRSIDGAKAVELVSILNKEEGMNVKLNAHDGRSAFAMVEVNGQPSINIGKDLSIGLILHEYAHCLCFRASYNGHGWLFTMTLDMLLSKYEEWL